MISAKGWVLMIAIAVPLVFNAGMRVGPGHSVAAGAGNTGGETGREPLEAAKTEPTLRQPSEPDRTIKSDKIASYFLFSRLDALLRRPDDASRATADLLLRTWVRVEPEMAFNWAKAVALTNLNSPVLEQAGTAWAEVDLRGALAAIERVQPGPMKDVAARSIAYEAARTDSTAALRLAMNLPADGSRDDLLEYVVSQWGATEFAAALAWAKGIPDAKLSSRLVSAAVMAEAVTDARVAAASVATEIPAGTDQNRAALVVAGRWALTSSEAVDWVEQFPSGNLRETAQKELAAIRKKQSTRGTRGKLQEFRLRTGD